MRSRIAIAVAVAAAFPAVSAVQAQAGARPQEEGICTAEFDAATSEIGATTLPDGRHPEWLARGVARAMTLFRLHRRDETLLKLDSAVKKWPGPWGGDVPRDRRQHERVIAAIERFRTCIAMNDPPATSTLTIRTYERDERAPRGRGRRPEGITYIDVDGIRVGQTGTDGAVTLRVPSGTIHLTATLYPSSWAEEFVTLEPGSSRTVSIVLDDSKEPAEDTDLELVEAVDDIIPSASRSFTLRFMRDDEPVQIARIWEVDLMDRDGNIDGALDKLFEIRDGAIAAIDPGAVFDAMAKRSAETVTLSVQASDTADRTHANHVQFRVGQFNLAVALSAPPSNPALSVSHIEVTVSVIGTAIRLRRVADANGRFEIPSLPHATLGFECETAVEGMYYYCDGTMVHSSNRSITLVLRHVSDVKKGVPALKVTVP
jgi:hypothetical protein